MILNPVPASTAVDEHPMFGEPRVSVPWSQWFQSLYQALTTPALILRPIQAATASAPPYEKGAIYFDTTLNKLRVGGAVGWETITSV